MLGLEVKSMEKRAGEFEGIVVAQVVSRDKHPNADKLSLCKVNDGQGERQIVCGAQNFKAGDKVPLILPGHALPAQPGQPPVTIKAGKIRGSDSQGMLCSPDELGLPEKVDGLLILREDAVVGQPFAEYLGRQAGDTVYDLEITPNRPDWNSVIGIAREVSALTGNAVRLPSNDFPSAQVGAEPTGAAVRVRVQDAELCPRYVARLIRNVKIGPSPSWLGSALEKCGLRPINNVVDVTNYVMLETGQPLHAFDFRLLGDRPAINIRRASAGEKFVTLDGQERELTENMLLIADDSKGIALAGIMGGKNSEISGQTSDVLLESASFQRQNIRVTARKLDLRTDSSYRFERGTDATLCDWASRRAALLILQTAGGQLDPALDLYPAPAAPRELELRPERTSQILGIDIPREKQVELLKSLGLESVNEEKEKEKEKDKDKHKDSDNDKDKKEKDKGPEVFRIPASRGDLKEEVDLIEEVARLYGIDKIPSTPPRGALGANAFDQTYDHLSEARRLLTGLGFSEAQGQTLISDAAAKTVADPNSLVGLQNPLSSDMNVLRPSLLPGLLTSLQANLARKNGDVSLFEIGRVFTQPGGHLKEERRLALAMTGRRYPAFWGGSEREARFDIYDLKGALEEFFEQFGLRGLSWVKREANLFFLEAAAIQLGKQTLGEFGQLSPALQRRYDLRDAAFFAELNLDLLLARRSPGKSFKALPPFPSIRRDVAMLVPENVTHDVILQAVKQARTPNLEKAELFDVFRGGTVPAGLKSVAYAFTYRGAERTLTDSEVNAAHETLVQHLKQSVGALVRDA